MVKRTVKPIPQGLRTVTAQLWFDGNCHQAIDFYKKAFGARVIGDIDSSPDGKVMHAHLAIGTARIFLADVMGSPTFAHGPTEFATSGYYLYVKDCDGLFKQSIEAGAKELMPLNDAFWGDRIGQLRDPYGHIWFVATRKRILTRKELKKAEDEWYEKFRSSTVEHATM